MAHKQFSRTLPLHLVKEVFSLYTPHLEDMLAAQKVWKEGIPMAQKRPVGVTILAVLFAVA